MAKRWAMQAIERREETRPTWFANFVRMVELPLRGGSLDAATAAMASLAHSNLVVLVVLLLFLGHLVVVQAHLGEGVTRSQNCTSIPDH